MAHHDRRVTATEIDHVEQRAGIGAHDRGAGKLLRLGVGGAMIDHGHAPTERARGRHDGPRIGSRAADQQMRRRRQELHECAQALEPRARSSSREEPCSSDCRAAASLRNAGSAAQAVGAERQLASIRGRRRGKLADPRARDAAARSRAPPPQRRAARAGSSSTRIAPSQPAPMPNSISSGPRMSYSTARVMPALDHLLARAASDPLPGSRRSAIRDSCRRP